MGGVDNNQSNLASTAAPVQGVFVTDCYASFVYCGVPCKNRFFPSFEAFNREVRMDRTDHEISEVRKETLMPAGFSQESS